MSLLLIHILVLFSFKLASSQQEPSDRFENCKNDDEEFSCKTAPNNNVNITKLGNAEFKRCPTTTTVCLEKNTAIVLGNNSGLYVENHSVLKLMQNAYVSMQEPNSICKVSGQSYLLVDHVGFQMDYDNRVSLRLEAADIIPNVIVHRGVVLKVWDRSRVKNFGHIFLWPFSSVKISQNSQVINYGMLQVYGSLVVGDYSSVRIATANSSIKASFPTGGSVRVQSHSSVVFEVCQEKQQIDLETNFTLKVDNFSNVRISGGILHMERAELSVSDSSLLKLSGKMRIYSSKLSVVNGGKLLIGGDESETCHDKSSFELERHSNLIIEGVLTVEKGAYCRLKRKYDQFGNVEVAQIPAKSVLTLTLSTNTTMFLCTRYHDAY